MFKQMFFPYDPRGNELEGKKKVCGRYLGKYKNVEKLLVILPLTEVTVHMSAFYLYLVFFTIKT